MANHLRVKNMRVYIYLAVLVFALFLILFIYYFDISGDIFTGRIPGGLPEVEEIPPDEPENRFGNNFIEEYNDGGNVGEVTPGGTVPNKKFQSVKVKPIIIPIIEIDDLEEKCKVDLECTGYIPCYRESTPHAFDRKVPLDGVKVSTCVTHNTECSPTYEVIERCETPKEVVEVITEKSETDVLLEPERLDSRKIVNIYDARKEEIVSTITVGDDGAVEIEFSQKSLDEILLSPPSFCMNGYKDLDMGEEGIDCGGSCRKCVIDKQKNYFAWFWWLLFGVMLSLLIYLDRKHIFRIKKKLKLGKRAMLEMDFYKSGEHYHYIRKNWNKLGHKDKIGLRQVCLEYYIELRDGLKKRGVFLNLPKNWDGLPPIIVKRGYGYADMEKTNVDRIDKLNIEGMDSISRGDIKESLANYNMMKEIYDSLDLKVRLKVRSDCGNHFKELSKLLIKRRLKYKVGKGKVPKVIIFGRV